MSRRRYRGSVIGTYVKPTSSTASGVYDLDTAIINTGLARWPAATAGSYRIPSLLFFAQGQKYNGSNAYSAYTIMSYYSATGTLVSETNPAGVSYRSYPGAAGYGIDKAVIQAGRYQGGSNSVNNVNLVTNTGTMGADITNSGTSPVDGPGAATYGFKNAIFMWGIQAAGATAYYTRSVWTFSDTEVWTSGGTTTYYHTYSTCTGYGTDTALAYSAGQRTSPSSTTSSTQSLVYINGLGNLAAEQSWAHSTASYWCSTRYGTDTAVLVDFSQTTKYYALITNTGTIGSDTSVSMASAWSQPSATALPGGSALFAYGQYNASNTLRPMLTMTNTGVFGSVTTVTENTNQSRCAAGYS